MPLDSVRLVTGDTDRVSVGGGAHSGRALRLGSIVMLNASTEIIEKGLRIASHVLEAAPADLEFSGGQFRVSGTDRTIGIFEVARAALERADLPEDLRGPLRGVMVISALWRCFSTVRMTLVSNLSPRILRSLVRPVSTSLRMAGVTS